MFSIIEEHYNELSLKIKTRQISSISIDALLISVHNTFHYAVVTGDKPFTSEILSLRECNSAERARSTLLLKLTHKEKSKANRSANGLAKKCRHKLRYFWPSFYGRMHSGEPTSDPWCYYMASSAECTVNIVSSYPSTA
jgi:hypothetical protein